MIAPTSIDDLHAQPGDLGTSDWQPVTRQDVDRFADATGDHVRMRASLDSVTARRDGADVATTLTFERAGGDRPACVAQLLIRVRA